MVGKRRLTNNRLYSDDEEEEQQVDVVVTDNGVNIIDDDYDDADGADSFANDCDSDSSNNSSNNPKKKVKKSNNQSTPKPSRKSTPKKSTSKSTPKKSTTMTTSTNSKDKKKKSDTKQLKITDAFSCIQPIVTTPPVTAATSTNTTPPLNNNNNTNTNDKLPIHPFFQAKEKEKKENQVKEQNQKTLQDKLRNTNGTVHEMFMTKEEKDREYQEKIQNEFRLGVIKSNEDHALVNAGKPIHPFFNSMFQSKSTSLDSPIQQVIDVDQKQYNLLDYPSSEITHIGWKGGINENIIDLESLETERHLKISEGGYVNDLEPNTIIPNYTDICIDLKIQQDPQSNNNNSQNNNNNNISKPEEVEGILKELYELIIKEFKLLNMGCERMTLDWLLSTYTQFKSSLVNKTLQPVSGYRWADYYYSDKFVQTFNSVMEDTTSTNQDSINEFNHWMSMWKEKDLLRSSTQPKSRKKKKNPDDEELSSAIVLYGPVGCGKSNLIYSVGNRHSYQIIEANPSTRRNGKYITEIFGEATQSKSLGIFNLNGDTKQKEKEKTPSKGKGKKRESTEVIKSPTKSSILKLPIRRSLNRSSEPSPPSSLSSSQSSSQSTTSTPTSTTTQQQPQQKNGTIMLFEEVDILYEEDRGFLTALSTLISASKVPIILTCNEITPSIIKLICGNDLNTIYMSKPNSAILVILYYFILIHENLAKPFINLPSLHSLLSLCNQSGWDIRQSINSLQFTMKRFNPSKDILHDFNYYYLNTTISRYGSLKSLLIGNQKHTYETITDKINTQLYLSNFNNINIYFNNYINLFTSQQPLQQEQQQQNNNNNNNQDDILEYLWKVSNDISYSDTLVPEDPTMAFVDTELSMDDFENELLEIDDNSPTFSHLNEAMHYHRSTVRWCPSSVIINDQIQSSIQVLSYQLYSDLYNESNNINNVKNNNSTLESLTLNYDLQQSKCQFDHRLKDIMPLEDSIFFDLIDLVSLSQLHHITYSQMVLYFNPFLSHICKSEEQRRINNPKRGNRFKHYLDLDEQQVYSIHQHNFIK